MLKVKPFSVKKLAEAMEKVLVPSKEIYQIAQNGYIYSKNFSWEQIERKYLQTVQEVLKNG
jgi:hypothetical protein